MCGLTGFFDPAGSAGASDLVNHVRRMSDALVHRGPDDSGEWSDENTQLAFGHRRLSIIDTSNSGHQPMVSANGQYVISFNGEIYNHLELRSQLEREGASPIWRGHSDTEVLLAAFAAWGVERTLKGTVGMFALALWDRQSRVLTLARDRAGEKPLYYGWQKGVFLFASELKALKAHASFHAPVDRGALALMLRHNCIPAPYSIYSGIHKLLPGHYLNIPVEARNDEETPSPEPYWKYNDVVLNGAANPFEGSDIEAADVLEAQLLESIGAQMMSDVPLGAFLSGGIDSSVIVAFMQAQSRQPVNTFTIGFDNNDYNEAVQAKAVARHLGTSHTELYVSPQDALAVVPKLPSIYCEPFSDSSQIPTYLVSALASNHVKVALSGDAGDELFGGYNRYLTAESVWRRMRRLPKPARKAVAALLASTSIAGWDRLFAAIGTVLPDRLRLRMPGEKAHKLAGVLLADDGASFYRHLVSHCQDPESIVLGVQEPATLLTRSENWPQTSSLSEWMMAMDAQTYMPDDILTKVDRAAMANSLETRVPFLDHRLIELAWRLPLSMKIRRGEGKWLLRQVLYRHVPRELVDRPKMGFGVPISDWLRSSLREWGEELLNEKRLQEEGFFDPTPIRKMWEEHVTGKHRWHYHLWDVLMFQAWLDGIKEI